ncbi:MAG: EamA family transporter [Halolamina sp.]
MSLGNVGYVAWAVLALVSYSLFTPLVKIATRSAPSHVVALVTNAVLVLAALAVTVVTGDDVTAALDPETLPYVLGGGVFLAVGILSYYRALAAGPVSVVVPVFGSFIAVSSLLGVVALGETLTARKLLGVTLATVGVYLAATG